MATTAVTMIGSFVEDIFSYRAGRIHAVVSSMVAGMIASVVWHFALDSSREIGSALFSYCAIAIIFLSALWDAGGPV